MVNAKIITQGRPTGSLAIMVSSDRHLDHVINLTCAAHAKGRQVSLFFTGNGVLLTMKPEFGQLAGKASVNICDASFRANGLHGRQWQVPGVTPANFTSQADHAKMLAQAERYIVF